MGNTIMGGGIYVETGSNSLGNRLEGAIVSDLEVDEILLFCLGVAHVVGRGIIWW